MNKYQFQVIVSLLLIIMLKQSEPSILIGVFLIINTIILIINLIQATLHEQSH